MIFWEYITIYLILSIVGGAGLFKASGKMEFEKQKENRIKYFMYLLLIAVMVICMMSGRIFYLSLLSVIAFFSARELSGISDSLRERGSAKWIFISTVVYLILVPGFFITIAFPTRDLLFLYTNVVVFDAFCQIVGQLAGKRKLIPKVSPGKTWEGLLGGMFFMAISFVILPDDGFFKYRIFDYLLIVFLALFGDLFASLIKRKAGIKDFSTLLPGQGGFMDRYDSLIAVLGGFGLLSILGVSKWLLHLNGLNF